MKSSSELSVFVVDDDKMFLTALTHQLETMFKTKTKIRTFNTGEECLKHLNENPDIIILDYYLNSTYKDAMNGLEILKRVMQYNSETKVIMLSGQEKMEVAVDSIKHGAYDYIVKNDNVFLRTKLSIINATNALSISKELKNFKFLIKVVIALVLLIIAGCVMLQIYYPELSGINHLK
jgi:two-component system, OmpR family, response regulator